MAIDPVNTIVDRRTKDGAVNSRLADLERRLSKLEKADPIHVMLVSGAPTFTPPYSGFPAYDKTNNVWYMWTSEHGWKSVPMT